MLRWLGSVLVLVGLVACQTTSPDQARRDAQLEEASSLLALAILCKPGSEAIEWQARIDACTQVLANDAFSDQKFAAYTNRGVLYRRVGMETEALADFDAAIAEEPESPIGYLNRGDFFSGQGKHDLAARDFRKALDLAPKNGVVLNHYAWSLAVRGNYADALAAIDEALSTGEALSQIKAPGSAVATPSRQIRSAANDTRAHALMGLGREDEAMTAFLRAIDIGGSERVSDYQNALAEKGYEPGRSDGVLDERTREALAACIRDNCRLLLD